MSEPAVATFSKEEAKPQQEQQKSKSIVGNVLTHVLIVALAVGSAMIVNKNYGTNIRQAALAGYEFITQADPSSAAIEGMIQDLETLREQTSELQLKVMDLITKTKGKLEEAVDDGEGDRYYMHQFEQYFRIQPTDKIEVDPKLAPYLKNYTLEEDPYYKSYTQECIDLNREFGPYIGRPSINDQRFYVAWVEEREEYGLFARVDIPTKAVLGYFTGVLQVRFDDVNDAWRYKATIPGDDGEPMYLVVDSRFKGNWFHFMRISEKGNSQAILVPKDNMWYIVFRTKRPIEAGEELLIGQDEIN